MMGAGKTAVGGALAKRLGIPFVDLDAWIEREAGRTVAEIFEEEGEAGFRRREAAALEAVLDASSAVVATGGGIVTSEALRARLRESGVVVFLEVSAETALERLAGEPGGLAARPLLSGPDPRRAWEDLEARRRAAYEACDMAVATEGKSPEAIADEIARRIEGEGGT